MLLQLQMMPLYVYYELQRSQFRRLAVIESKSELCGNHSTQCLARHLNLFAKTKDSVSCLRRLAIVLCEWPFKLSRKTGRSCNHPCRSRNSGENLRTSLLRVGGGYFCI